MNNTLLLRICAPMQSWGVSSRFGERETTREPTKSGIVGLLCAAMGIGAPRTNIEDPVFAALVRLKMGVRVLKEGIPESDYHTTLDVARADGTRPTRPGNPKMTQLSLRHYLADADFLVALESDDLNWLQSVQKALIVPKWQLYFGRKAFAPALPVYLREGVISGVGAEEFLKSGHVDRLLGAYDKELKLTTWLAMGEQRLIIEDDQTGTIERMDSPICFERRLFANRRTRVEFIKPRPAAVREAEEAAEAEAALAETKKGGSQ